MKLTKSRRARGSLASKERWRRRNNVISLWYWMLKRKHTWQLFVVLAAYAWFNDLYFDCVAFGALALLSCLNHCKILPCPRFYHIIDVVYAYFIAAFYLCVAGYRYFFTRNTWFLMTVVAGVATIYIYFSHVVEPVYVHVGVFLGGAAYITGMI
jgi:hypothetical protein